MRRKKSVAMTILRCPMRHVVLSAVGLNHKAFGKADEIDDVAANGSLASEMKTEMSEGTKFCP